jgi:hypothetical protein
VSFEEVTRSQELAPEDVDGVEGEYLERKRMLVI